MQLHKICTSNFACLMTGVLQVLLLHGTTQQIKLKSSIVVH